MDFVLGASVDLGKKSKRLLEISGV